MTPPPQVDRSGVFVHICFLGLNEESDGLLTRLRGVPACFFAAAGELYGDGDLVRSILGSGCTVGLLARDDPAGEYGEFARALQDTAMSATFLCAGVELPESAAEAADEAGLCFLPASEALNDLSACLRVLNDAEGRCDLFLSGRFGALEELLEVLERDRYTLEAVTEVTMGGRTP